MNISARLYPLLGIDLRLQIRKAIRPPIDSSCLLSVPAQSGKVLQTALVFERNFRMHLDQTDWQIVSILTEHHQTNSEIARRLKLSEGAVRQRIKKLTESGALQIKALRNPNVLANQQLAFVMIGVKEARLLDSKAQEIARLKNVLSVSIISGQYDLLVEVLVDSNQGLMQFLTKGLASIDGITKTESLIVLNSYNKFI